MDAGHQDLTLEDFLHWKVDALREFLGKRGLGRDGTKQELAALCFSANIMKLTTLPSAKDVYHYNKKSYEDLLYIDKTKLPDPLQLCDGWFDEKIGMGKWPPIFITDITNFLITCESPSEVKKRLNEYKIGKAYEYYHCNWLKEVFYHEIAGDCDFCFLRAWCTPSQRLNDEDHSVWVCASKDSGEIKSAYCSCTAG